MTFNCAEVLGDEQVFKLTYSAYAVTLIIHY